MSSVRRESNVLLASIAIFVLFIISNLFADPAAGAAVDADHGSATPSAQVIELDE